MKTILAALLLAAALVFSASAAPAKAPVLLVLTSHSELGKTGKKTGAYLSEVSHPYYVFKEAGHPVTLASIRGGKPPLDGLDVKDAINDKFLADPVAQTALAKTPTLASLKPGDFGAIFFAGGHGTMFDFPDDPAVLKATAAVYERGGVVAAVCHGPAALVNVTLSNGTPLVKGREVSAFTNEEEAAVQLTEAMPFLLETRLVERGAKFLKAPNFQKQVAVSGRLVTGQNPASATGVAEAVVRLLNAPPQ